MGNKKTLTEDLLKSNPKPEDIKFFDNFIVVEGIDGSGKSTFCSNLLDWLLVQSEKSQRKCLLVKQPGNTPVAEEIRSILKRSGGDINPRTKHLLFETARLDLMLSLKKLWAADPSLLVISDRHRLSTSVYQLMEGVDSADIWTMNDFMYDSPEPDLTFFIDVPVEIAIKRISSNGRFRDDYDNKPVEFFEKCRDQYIRYIKSERLDYVVLDGSKSQMEILEQAIPYLRNLK